MSALASLQELYNENPVLAISLGAALVIGSAVLRFWIKKVSAEDDPTVNRPDASLKPMAPLTAASHQPGSAQHDAAAVAMSQWREKLAGIAASGQGDLHNAAETRPTHPAALTTNPPLALIQAESHSPVAPAVAPVPDAKEQSATKIRERLKKFSASQNGPD